MLPHDGPIEMLILKVIERELTALIESRCLKPEKISSCRLTFFQKLQLTQALCSTIGLFTGDLEFLIGYNKVRNKLAHTLDPENIEHEIDKLIKNFYSDEPVGY